jgi:hypothetical protein
VDSRRFAETVGRVNTHQWEQRIQHGASDETAAAVNTPPPPRRREQAAAKTIGGTVGVEMVGSVRLTEASVNQLEEEARETMVKAWVESTSSENIHEVRTIFFSYIYKAVLPSRINSIRLRLLLNTQ